MAPLDVSQPGKVFESSRRYSDVTTELSKLIVETEQFLNSLPGKREVAVEFEKSTIASPSLTFARTKNGAWGIFYEHAALVQALTPNDPNNRILLRDASVELKLKAAPVLAKLLEALKVALDAESSRAASAIAAIRSALGSMNQGGQ